MAATHEVTNQVPPLRDVNLYRIDATLAEAIAKFGGAWGDTALREYGALAGGELAEHGRLANRYPPELKTHDPYGHRIDEVVFHPSYHVLMQTAVAHGVHGLAWEAPHAGDRTSSGRQGAPGGRDDGIRDLGAKARATPGAIERNAHRESSAMKRPRRLLAVST